MSHVPRERRTCRVVFPARVSATAHFSSRKRSKMQRIRNVDCWRRMTKETRPSVIDARLRRVWGGLRGELAFSLAPDRLLKVPMHEEIICVPFAIRRVSVLVAHSYRPDWRMTARAEKRLPPYSSAHRVSQQAFSVVCSVPCSDACHDLLTVSPGCPDQAFQRQRERFGHTWLRGTRTLRNWTLRHARRVHRATVHGRDGGGPSRWCQ